MLGAGAGAGEGVCAGAGAGFCCSGGTDGVAGCELAMLDFIASIAASSLA